MRVEGHTWGRLVVEAVEAPRRWRAMAAMVANRACRPSPSPFLSLPRPALELGVEWDEDKAVSDPVVSHLVARLQVLLFRVSGFGFRVSGLPPRRQVAGAAVYGLGFRVEGGGQEKDAADGGGETDRGRQEKDAANPLLRGGTGERCENAADSGGGI